MIITLEEIKKMDSIGSSHQQMLYVNADIYEALQAKSKHYFGYEFNIQKKIDPIKEFSKLPSFVSFEGIQFSLCFFINHTDDMRLVYKIYDVDDNSKHKKQYDEYGCWDNPLGVSPFDDDVHTCSFLWLEEYIRNEDEFLDAINRCQSFLERIKSI